MFEQMAGRFPVQDVLKLAAQRSTRILSTWGTGCRRWRQTAPLSAERRKLRSQPLADTFYCEFDPSYPPTEEILRDGRNVTGAGKAEHDRNLCGSDGA